MNTDAAAASAAAGAASAAAIVATTAKAVVKKTAAAEAAPAAAEAAAAASVFISSWFHPGFSLHGWVIHLLGKTVFVVPKAWPHESKFLNFLMSPHTTNL